MRNPLESIVRILGGPSPDELAFLGTGMLVKPDRILTCRHVVGDIDPLGRRLDTVMPSLCVENATGQRVAVDPEENAIAPASTWDLALLTLVAPLPGDSPPFLWGLTKALEPTLCGARLEVFGYANVEQAGPLWRHSINQLLLLPSYRAVGDTLTQFQLAGGLPEGVSGSPVLLAVGDQWAYVGTVYLGGERSATSRVIMADPVVEFLVGTARLRGLKRVDATRALALAPGTPILAEGLIQQPEGADIPPCPYQHLNAFQEIDAPYFHGRATESQQLVDTVQQHPHPPGIVLVGASGSGKSSLVLAGVIPRLRHDPRWHIAVCKPGRDPFGALAAALAPGLYPDFDEVPRLKKAKELADELRLATLGIGQVINRIAEIHPTKRLLLVLDQFEELYTHPLPEQQQRFLLEELLALLQGPSPCTVLLTLRADFLGQVLSSAPWVEVFNTSRPQYLGPMAETGLRAAIEQPAHTVGVMLQPGLADRMLEDLRQAPGSLPLLQFALAELWPKQQQAQLTHAAYDEIGGVHKALATYADGVLAQLRTQEARLRRVFVQLVRPGEGTQDTRQVATRAQVGDINWALVRRLADARLVVTGRDAQGQETVEVVHEALIRYWAPLQQWMAQDGQFRAWQNRVRQDAQEWEHRHHDEGTLLRGTRLAEAEEKLQHYGEVLPREEQEYIRASIHHRDQEQAAQAQARQERERLYYQQHQVFVGVVAPCLAALLGALTRVPLSGLYGTFLSLPLVGVEPPPQVLEWLQPAWHGLFGTFVGSLYVVAALQLFLRERARVTLVQALLLVLAGPLWGISVSFAVSAGFNVASRHKLAWDTYQMWWGFLITSLFWAVGIAGGTYLGDRLPRRASCLTATWRTRLWGGLGGVLCCSLLSPWVVGRWLFHDAPALDYPALLLRAWGDAGSQGLSAWAALLCFYWVKRWSGMPGASDSETPHPAGVLQEGT